MLFLSIKSKELCRNIINEEIIMGILNNQECGSDSLYS